MSRSMLSRRNMLKLMGVSLAGTYALAACAAPAGSGGAEPASAPASAEPVTMQVMVWGGAERAELRDTVVRSVYPELNDQHTVEVVVGGGGDFEVAEALRLALAAGTGIPDIIQFNRTQIPEFAAADELLVLDEIYGEYQDDMYSGANAISTYEGHFVCFPFEIKSKLFFYRADLLEEAGIRVEDIKTVNDFITSGQAFHDQYPESYILNLGPQPVQYWLGELLSPYEDARMADEGGNYLVTEHQAFADTFQFMKDVYDAGIAMPIDDWSSDWQQAFKSEAICGSLIATWMKLFLPSFAPDQVGLWKAALWPKFEPMADQQYGSEAGGAVYVVPKRSANPLLAAEYLTKMFLDKTGALAIMEASGIVPLMKSAKEEALAIAGNMDRPEGEADDVWNARPAVFLGTEYFETEIASYDYARVFPYDPSATKEVGILQQWLFKHLAGEVSQADALSGAQADMESQIGNPYEI